MNGKLLPVLVGAALASSVLSVAPATGAGHARPLATSPQRQVTPEPRPWRTDLRGSPLAYLTWRGPNPFEADLSFGTLTLRVSTLPRGRRRIRSCFIARAS